MTAVAHVLIHITCGPENPSKAALGFLVAKVALEEGNTVSLFLAIDAVQLLRPEILAGLRGIGTGDLGQHAEALRSGGARFFVSSLSAASRGVGADCLDPFRAEPAGPSVLLRLAADADVTLTY